jgi:hypothetical protein
MKWVIQSNLGHTEDLNRIRDACTNNGSAYESVKVIPFSPEIPELDTEESTIFYGATNFINNIHKSGRWKPGTFFNEDTFTIKAYNENYKNHMINSPCELTTIGKFASSHQPQDKLFFVRPIKDLKEFAGEVMEFEKIVKWERTIRYLPGCDNNPNLTPETEIAVSEPWGIAHEWRLFVIDGKVSSGSHYRAYGRLDKEGGVPDRVKDFVEEMSRIWTPADVFVMDVGESSGNLFIIECNCFNSSGFYKSDIEKIIVDVSEFITRKEYPHGQRWL